MVCVYSLISYLLSHCMQPEGLWQRLAAVLADSSDHFSAFKLYPVPTTCESYRGSPITFLPCPPNKGKRNNTQDKGKENFVFSARPPPTRRGPKLRLISIPYIHRRGLRSRILARGLDHTSYSALSDAEPQLWGSNRSHSFCPPLEREGWLTGRVAGTCLVVSLCWGPWSSS